ncbi:MAG: hypothetical protein IT258_03725 [Saprospiraceae bacterium]|nr:hypothetical protein [Saprospiraceae bacterium]
MKLLKFSILLLSVSLLAACGKKPKASQINIKSNEFFELKVGNTAIIPEDKFKLTFTGVPEDSRCPKFVTCIQEGQIKMTFVAVIDGKSQPPVELVRKPSDKRPATADIGAYKIQVYDITPERENGKQLNPADYKARMTVKKAQMADKAEEK